MSTLGLDTLPGRCPNGFDVATQHPGLCSCTDTSEWGIFVAALKQVAVDGIVHQSAMRRLIRGRIEPKHVGTFYRRAKAEGLIRDTGEREPSDDVAGRNQDKLDRVYALAVAA
jgi:hypothetical protein